MALALALTVAVCVRPRPLEAAAAPAKTSATKASGANTAKLPNAAADARLIDFLQKRFKIPEANRIKLGPASPAGVDGLLQRQVEVTTDRGQKVRVFLYTDRSETRMIIGTLFDLSKNPWGRLDMKLIHLKDRPSLGPANAPVTMVEFADFECPFCAHAFTIVETLANSTYKGKLRVIFKNYPLNVHPWAVRAAEAAECVRLQNPAAFWDVARYLYSHQSQITSKNLDSRIDAYVHQLGLDVPALHACVKAPATLARIRQDHQDGEILHVGSTPTFYINGIPVVGLPEGKVFNFVIDHELEAAKKRAARRPS